jgi:hypothetical protein
VCIKHVDDLPDVADKHVDKERLHLAALEEVALHVPLRPPPRAVAHEDPAAERFPVHL